MFIIELNGKYFCSTDSSDPKYALISGNLHTEFNKAGTLEFSVPIDNAIYNYSSADFLRKPVTVKYVRNRDALGIHGASASDIKHAWSGRIISYFIENGIVTFNCEGSLAVLNDTYVKEIFCQDPGAENSTSELPYFGNVHVSNLKWYPDDGNGGHYVSDLPANQIHEAFDDEWSYEWSYYYEDYDLYFVSPKHFFLELIQSHNDRVYWSMPEGYRDNYQILYPYAYKNGVETFNGIGARTEAYYETGYTFPKPDGSVSTMEYIQQNFINNNLVGGRIWVGQGKRIYYYPDALWTTRLVDRVLELDKEALGLKETHDGLNIVSECIVTDDNGRLLGKSSSKEFHYKCGHIEHKVTLSQPSNGGMGLIESSPWAIGTNEIYERTSQIVSYEVKAVDLFDSEFLMAKWKSIDEKFEEYYENIGVGKMVRIQIKNKSTQSYGSVPIIETMCTSSNIDLTNPLNSSWEFCSPNSSLTPAQKKLYYKEILPGESSWMEPSWTHTGIVKHGSTTDQMTSDELHLSGSSADLRPPSNEIEGFSDALANWDQKIYKYETATLIHEEAGTNPFDPNSYTAITKYERYRGAWEQTFPIELIDIDDGYDPSEVLIEEYDDDFYIIDEFYIIDD